MSYFLQEQSEYLGQPQEGYTFEYLTTTWNYTGSKQEVVMGELSFNPTYIKRSGLKNEQDMFKTTLTVTVAATNEVAMLFRTWIESPVLLTIYRQHYGDGDTVVLWSGKIASCKFKGNIAELACNPLYTTMKKLGIKRVYQRACPYVQYGSSCKLAVADWQRTATITEIAGSVVTFDGNHPTNFYTGGSITVGSERRWVLSSDAASVSMVSPFVYAAIGDTATLLPGCQHSATKCKDTFNNLLNNGGFFFIPKKNPFRVSLLG